MALTVEQIDAVDDFLTTSDFLASGAVITDLDGTAVHEVSGATLVHKDVGAGLKKVYDMGRPVVINTLRFPLSVIRTFGKEWYKISTRPVPVILLNGSQLGYLAKHKDEFVFDTIATFPVTEIEIGSVLSSLRHFKNVLNDIILFYYPADWTKGEIIWTADKNKISFLQHKYKSAAKVFSCSVSELADSLQVEPLCMMLLLIDTKQDKLMAYQHTKRENFITAVDVNKRSGTVQMADLLGIKLKDSVGAGDSEMDLFLDST
ncbi:MAG TPA: HAD hydrolase family protein, partial [Chitinophagaceae bacterium]|nr:HAD hydrolase family protein [Chitinophagaceae bacterium]